MDILSACNDPDLDEETKAFTMLQIFYPEWRKIPPDCIQEAIDKAVDFIDCGNSEDGSPKPKLMDWDQDASLIVPEINKVAGKEIRATPDIHWWTVMGWFMAIEGGLFGNVLSIRKKIRNGEKLEKWEREFFNENISICVLKQPLSQDQQNEINDIIEWMKG